ncbi:MAG: hypothetical protein WDO14_15585 [Bacteroidota bacterium]
MKNITTNAEHLDREYGKRGTKKREEFERGFQKFYQEAEAMLEIEKEEKLKAKRRRLANSSAARAGSRA